MRLHLLRVISGLGVTIAFLVGGCLGPTERPNGAGIEEFVIGVGAMVRQ